jgi:ComEC/Rec2-related protein
VNKRIDPTGGSVGLAIGFGAVTGAGLACWTSGVLVTLIAVFVSVFGFGWLVCRTPSTADEMTRRTERRRLILISVGTAALFLLRSQTLLGIEPSSFRVSTESTRLVEVEGQLLESPQPLSAGSKRFRSDVLEPPTMARFEVRRRVAIGSVSDSTSIAEVVSVRFDRPASFAIPGVRIRLIARLEPMRPIGNPGERTRSIRRAAKLPAILVVSDSRLVTVSTDAAGEPILDWWILLRSSIRGRLMAAADRVAGAGFRGSSGGGLIRSLLVGDRRDLDDAVRRDFTRTGLAHLLAISGLHLAVLAAIPWFVLEWIGVGRRIRSLAAVTLLTGYGWILDSTASIDRATFMGVAMFLGVAMGMRFRPVPLLASAATILLWMEPGLVEQTGFQLSFVATAALVVSMSQARTRWFGPRDAIGMTRLAIIRNRWTAVLSAAIVAWLSTMPIVESRFGVVAIIAVPATLLVAPPVALILIAGFPLLMLAHFTPALAEVLATPIRWFSQELCGQLATLSEAAPIATAADFGPAWTTIATVLAVIVPGLDGPPRWRIGGGLILAVMLMLPLVPGLRNDVGPELRIDQLAVGDGTSILLRTPGGSVLFDAGSASINRAGERLIVPALRALGVRHLDAIVISHPNLDHFGGAIDVVNYIPTDRIIVSEDFSRTARAKPMSVVREHLDRLRRSGPEIEVVARGRRRILGGAEWMFLHPGSGEKSRTVNDGSLVALVTPIGLDRFGAAAGIVQGDAGSPLVQPPHAEFASQCGVLLVGDLQDEGVARILQREPYLRAAVIELPHHGSWRPIVEQLIDRIDPRIVLQSTGRRRFASDRFGRACEGRIRFVTCRDGATTVVLDGTGAASIRTRRTGFIADIFLSQRAIWRSPNPIKAVPEASNASQASHPQTPCP